MTPKIANGAGLAGIALRAQPDERLLRLFREGNERAFDEIVRRHRPRLLAYAAAIASADRAEDVLQDALAKAHLALRRGEQVQLRPWLYRVVRNTALNDLRDNRRHLHARLDESYDGVEQPASVLERREAIAALVAGIGDLPRAQREAIVKREFEGASHEQIAAALRLSPGAVRQLIYRARRSLREAAGMLLPMPLLRALGGSEPTRLAEAAAGSAADAGLSAAFKGGVAALALVSSLGAGVAIRSADNRPDGDKARAERAPTVAASVAGGASGRDGDGGSEGSGRHRGEGRDGDDDRSGRRHSGEEGADDDDVGAHRSRDRDSDDDADDERGFDDDRDGSGDGEGSGSSGSGPRGSSESDSESDDSGPGSGSDDAD